MRRLVTPAIAVCCAGLLAACGEATITITERAPDTSGFVTVSATVTSDGTAIDAFTTNFRKLTAADSPAPVLSTGDNHSGSIICTYTASKNGHSYQVTVYAVGQPPDAASLCSASNRTSFVNELP